MDGWLLVVLYSGLSLVAAVQSAVIGFVCFRLFKSHDRAIDQAMAVSEANLLYMRYDYDKKVAEVELGHQNARRNGRWPTVPTPPKEPPPDISVELPGGGIG